MASNLLATASNRNLIVQFQVFKPSVHNEIKPIFSKTRLERFKDPNGHTARLGLVGTRPRSSAGPTRLPAWLVTSISGRNRLGNIANPVDAHFPHEPQEQNDKVPGPLDS